MTCTICSVAHIPLGFVSLVQFSMHLLNVNVGVSFVELFNNV